MSQIKIKQVEGLQVILDSLIASVTAGSVKSVYTQANHGFTPGIAVSYMDGTWVPADASSEDKLGRLIIESTPTANTFVGVQVGTITVSTWDLIPGKYYVVDTLGTGHLAEFTTNEAYPFSNPVMQAITSTTAHVLPWRPSVGVVSFDLPVQTVQQNLVPAATSGNYSATGITIQYTPYADGAINVLVNGISVLEGDGIKTSEVYFSADGGATAKAIADIAAGDQLIWNGHVAGFDLTSDDKIDIEYQRSSLS